jgi:ribosomal protein L35
MQEGNKAERKCSYLLVSSLDADASPKSWLAQSCSRGLIHGPRVVKEEEVVASVRILHQVQGTADSAHLVPKTSAKMARRFRGQDVVHAFRFASLPDILSSMLKAETGFGAFRQTQLSSWCIKC